MTDNNAAAPVNTATPANAATPVPQSLSDLTAAVDAALNLPSSRPGTNSLQPAAPGFKEASAALAADALLRKRVRAQLRNGYFQAMLLCGHVTIEPLQLDEMDEMDDMAARLLRRVEK